MKQRDILKYEKIMEDTLTDQVYISSLNKKSEKREKVEFICDVVSQGGHTKKMTVSVEQTFHTGQSLIRERTY